AFFAMSDGPAPHISRDLLATAAGIGNDEFLIELMGHLRVPFRDGDGKPWQYAAVRGALDALERQGKRWEKLPGQLREAFEPVVVFARKLSEKPDAAEDDLLAALPLLGRDPAARAEDVKRLAGMLAATRPAAVQTAAVAALARITD